MTDRRAIILLVAFWALVALGLYGCHEATAAPAEATTSGGSLPYARSVAFQALKALETRGHHVDRSQLRVRVIPKGHACEDTTACATAHQFNGERTVWLSRELVAEHGWVEQPWRVRVVGAGPPHYVTWKRRRPSCLLWNIATHELMHHESTLRVTYVYPGTGYRVLARANMDEAAYDRDHERIMFLADVYTAQAKRNGRCVDGAMGSGGFYDTHEWPQWTDAAAEQIAAGVA